MTAKLDDKTIIIYNLIVFVAYNLLSRFLGDAGVALYLMLWLGHVFYLIVYSIYRRNLKWILGALVVLLIGFSTCVYVPWG
jgi:hypothetical protein